MTALPFRFKPGEAIKNVIGKPGHAAQSVQVTSLPVTTPHNLLVIEPTGQFLRIIG